MSPGTSWEPFTITEAEYRETIYAKRHDANGQVSIRAVPMAGGAPRLDVNFQDPSRQSSRLDLTVGRGTAVLLD